MLTDILKVPQVKLSSLGGFGEAVLKKLLWIFFNLWIVD